MSFIWHAIAVQDSVWAAYRYYNHDSAYLGYSKAQSEAWLNELAEVGVEKLEDRDLLQLVLF